MQRLSQSEKKKAEKKKAMRIELVTVRFRHGLTRTPSSLASAMPRTASVSHFFKSERSAEALYEVSHRIGKGSYG
eukprot:COSAG04_NODE_19973_length_403_cov_1.703947_1_plen_74_part_10